MENYWPGKKSYSVDACFYSNLVGNGILPLPVFFPYESAWRTSSKRTIKEIFFLKENIQSDDVFCLCSSKILYDKEQPNMGHRSGP